jgi:arginine repressor
LDLAPVAEVVGTIAGDDTVFVATTSTASADDLASQWLETDQGKKVMEVGA